MFGLGTCRLGVDVWCERCGEPLSEGARFCGACGAATKPRQTRRVHQESVLVIKPSLLGAITIPVFIFGVMYATSVIASAAQKHHAPVLEILSGLAAVVSLIVLVMAIPMSIAYYASARVTLGPRSIVAKNGLIRRRSFELPLERVEGIGIEQTLSERLLGAATIEITGTGRASKRMRWMSGARELQSAALARIG